MPVTADSFLWEATGFFVVSAPIVVTHPDAGGTTAGSTVLIAFCLGSSPTITAPTGFASLFTSMPTAVYAKSNVGAGETSWSFTIASGIGTWYLVELSDDVALVDPYDGTSTATNAALTDGGTLASGSAANVGSSGAALAFFHASKPATTDVQSWSGYTNGFTERVDVSPASGSIDGRTLAVAWNTYEGLSSLSTTATFATTAASASASARILRLRASEASINAPLAYCTTFGFGTHAGMSASTGGTTATSRTSLGRVAEFPVGTWGTNYSVGAYGRDGRTGLEISAAAAVVNIRMPTAETGGTVFGGNVEALSGSGTPTALHWVCGAESWSLLYDVTNEKFGVQWTGGTAVWQTGTTPVGTFAWVDVSVWNTIDTWHLDWSIETGDGSQTSPADLTGLAPAVAAVSAYLGSLSSQTGVFHYSDLVYSSWVAAYPLGPHVVRVLPPETTGATVSGTAANFNKFTANGTLAAWAGDAGALLDDIPPTISASSDGVVQNAVAASDYMEFPMTTYTLAADEIIAGVRAFASLWGGTGSGTGTLGFRGHDGVTEKTFIAASVSFDPDSLTTASATYPIWYAFMWLPASGSRWNQTKLDPAVLRGGFSTDATPDMGFSCMGLEVATRNTPAPLVAHRLTSDEDPENVAATVTERLHPYTSGVRTYTVTNNDASRTAEFRFYETGGAEHADSPIAVAPLDPPVDVTIGAETFGDIESTTFGWQ